MNKAKINLELCDREPIHIPGSIQPHGLMLVATVDERIVTYSAGDVEKWTGRADWQGCAISELLGEQVDAAARRLQPGRPIVLSSVSPPRATVACGATLHVSGAWTIIEFEPESLDKRPTDLLEQVDAALAVFEHSRDLERLFDAAAREFHRLCDYDRVMIYRFLDDDSGVVVGEFARPPMVSLMNHHFPASDIPKQARQLYLRNLVRVIPDIGYTPVPLVPLWSEEADLDMSDCVLRSVSPIHLQYMKNMNVAGSASISIVTDGVLWGLVACHNSSPKIIPRDRRTACRALAAGLARQIKLRQETEHFRQRARLRTLEDEIVELLAREGPLDKAISKHRLRFMRMLDGDGVAVLRGTDLLLGGECPPEAEVRALATWCVEKTNGAIFKTQRLGDHYRLPDEHQPLAAGVLAIALSSVEPWIVLWFRAEEVQVVNWAGNPHKGEASASGVLNPRASFEAWSETVRGLSRRWSIPEIEAAGRLRSAVVSVWQNRRIRDLNRELLKTVDEKDVLIRQKEFLMGEVNHRVQNSLQLVSSFLAMQARGSIDEAARSAIEEAQRRIRAVSLVHRRLYKANQVDAIDMAQYVDELLNDLVDSMGEDWSEQVERDLQSSTVPTDCAISLGLILTELVINANKYAYVGAAGPIHVALGGEGNRIRLTVADSGTGIDTTRHGFGSRMMEALIRQLGGTLEFEDNAPGTRAVVTVPIQAE